MIRMNCLLVVFLCCCLHGWSQTPDSIYMSNVRTPQLFLAGNQVGYPILTLGGSGQLELDFDDLDGDVKNYYYTYQLCNADWTPAMVSEVDFIRGFSNVRIGAYQFSSVALTHYTHYQAAVPDQNCVPIRSGNYLLKVFLDNDTSKLAFTRRFLITDVKTNVHSQFLQPMNYDLAHTHQRISFTVNTSAVNPPNPLDQIKVYILQNYRWDNAIHDIKPTFYLNNKLEYNEEDLCVFPGGSEWRWADLQTFRYQSDRIKSANYGKTSTEIFMKPDADRSQQDYLYYQDYNGAFSIRTTESINPVYQGDYARVHFSFVPTGNTAFTDKDVYLLAQFTGGSFSDSTHMIFNEQTNRYEGSFLLKQGYYSYSYVTIDRNDPDRKTSFAYTEGDHIETDNEYTILVYYRPLGGRADELIGISKFSTRDGKN